MEDVKCILEMCQESLEPPEDFSFPFPPYSIQKDFMINLYKAIEGRKLGIFESPTGTGKSLSIICGALTWLNDHEEREKNELTKAIDFLKSNTNSKSTDWLTEQIKEMENQSVKAEIKRMLDKIEKKNEEIDKIKKKAHERAKKKISGLKRNIENHISDFNETTNDKFETEDNEEDFILQEFNENPYNDEESDREEDSEEKEKYIDTKIIFCSRTHSQLSQFISELRKTHFSEDTRIAPLASRQSYCINKAVNKLKSISLINEKCLELQRASKGKTTVEGEDGERIKKKKSGSGCPKMRGVPELAEQLVTRVFDVEELKAEGELTGACPYYASRAAVSTAQVVIVPYNTLLHKSTRQACGLEIENSVIIIDEAHNILETISHIHSTKITGQQLTHAYSQLTQYKDRYEKRFSALNLMYLKQLIFIIGCFIKIAGGKPGCGSEESSNTIIDSRLYSINDFVTFAQIDTFNLFKLVNFCSQSKIMQKISGFTEKYVPTIATKPRPVSSGIKAFLQEISKNNNTPPETDKVENKEEERLTGQPLQPILSFLENLTLNNNDGRVIVSTGNIVAKSSIKFLLLDPAVTVKDIISKARSVILAGGTMEPKGELQERLFIACDANPSRIVNFSCGHVIPPSHILPIILTSGPTGKKLDFSYESRGSTANMNELGRVLVNMCNTVPAGIVCFFPSYEYENSVFTHLQKHGIIENISKKKKVFREPKKSSEVESVLSDYAKAIHTATGKNGALLFSVVGGKLSEGLNFSDDLGRCVMVVGMPYPNIKSPELVEKMNYLDANVGRGAGREHYEACCMKAVNQSIGRAVRHKGDYAVVLLLDHRYSSQRVQKSLPAWIKTSLVIEEKFPSAFANVVKFFKHHEKSTVPT